MSVSESRMDVNMNYRSSNHGVLLPKVITYCQLLEYVKNRFRIEDDCVTRLYFRLGKRDFEVSDDDSVEHFAMHVIKRKVGKLMITTSNQSRCEVCSSCSMAFDLVHRDSVSGSDKNVNFVHPQSQEECVNTGYKYAWQLTNTFKPMPTAPSKPLRRNLLDRACACILKVGDEFQDKDECIFQLGKKALFESFEYIPTKSCSLRYAVRCAQAECQWSIFASKLPGCDKFFIKRANDIHTCSKTQINPNHRNATVKLISRLIAPRFSDWTRVYKPKDIQNDFKVDYKAIISYRQAWLAKERAIKTLMGCPVKSFHELPFYCYNLKLKNAGTVTDIRSDDNGRFEIS